MYDEFLHVTPDQMRAEVVRREHLETQCDRYREALAELVRLKDGPRDEEYHQLKPHGVAERAGGT